MAKVTIQSIAELCGVSVATVSRAVNDSGYVNAELKRKILNCIEDAGWQTNSLQGRLKSKKTHSIAVVGQLELLDGNAEGIRRILEEIRKRFQQTPALYLGPRMESLMNCLETRPKSVLVLGISDRLEKPVRLLQKKGIRVVGLGDLEKPFAPAVSDDHFDVGRRAAEFLKNAGHHKIGFFGGFGAKAHLSSLKSVRPLRVQQTLSGICSVLSDFDPERDAVSDCFGDLKDFRAMLYGKEYTAWIIFGDEHYRYYLDLLHANNMDPLRDRPAAAILSGNSPLPMQALRFFRQDPAAELSLLTELLDGSLPDGQYKVKHIEI